MKSRAGGIWGNEHCRAEFLYLCICLVFIYSDRGETSADLTPRGCCPILALVPPRGDEGHVLSWALIGRGRSRDLNTGL